MDITTAKTPATSTGGIARISGRIERSRSISTQNGTLRLSLLRLPAHDEFSFPSTVEVQSRSSLGAAGETVTVTVRVGGRARSYDVTDGYGDKVKVASATNTLEAVEG